MRQVYLINAIGTQKYKIGTTKDIDARLKSLQTGSPHKLVTVKCISGGHLLENRIHRHYCDYRAGGEWFSFDDSTLERVVADMDKSSTYEIDIKDPDFRKKTEMLSFRTTPAHLGHLRSIQDIYDLNISHIVNKMIGYFVKCGDAKNTFKIIYLPKEGD